MHTTHHLIIWACTHVELIHSIYSVACTPWHWEHGIKQSTHIQWKELKDNYVRQQEVQTSTSPSRVFSILPFTILAYSGSLSTSKWAVTIGVLMVREALIISLIRGTPSVICDMLSRINHLQDWICILLACRNSKNLTVTATCQIHAWLCLSHSSALGYTQLPLLIIYTSNCHLKWAI